MDYQANNVQPISLDGARCALSMFQANGDRSSEANWSWSLDKYDSENMNGPEECY